MKRLLWRKACTKWNLLYVAYQISLVQVILLIIFIEEFQEACVL